MGLCMGQSVSVSLNLANITDRVKFLDTMKVMLFCVIVPSLSSFWLRLPSHADNYPPVLGRALHSPTIIPSPYSAKQAATLAMPGPGDIGCVSELRGTSPFYTCRGVTIQKLDVYKTTYGWRVPFIGNGQGHAVRVYVPNVRHGIIQTL